MAKKRAIIIGAGPAGLTAAYELLRYPDWQPVILEASDRIGGISRTERYHGNRIDIGGHRFFSKSRKVTDLWLSLLPPQGAPACDDRLLGRTAFTGDGPDPEQTDPVMLERRRVSRIFYRNRFFDYPVSFSRRTIAAMGIGRTCAAGLSYLRTALLPRRERSLEDFYINRFGRALYRMFFEDYTEKLWGIHPSAIAPDWGRQRVKGISIAALLKRKLLPGGNRKVETSLIESFWYPKFGPGQLWEKMAEEICRRGGEIRLNAAVTGIRAEHGRIAAVQVAGDAAEIAGDVFFSSMPVCDLAAAMGSALSPEGREIAAGLPYRDFITVGLLVPRLKLRNRTGMPTVNGLIPDCWIYLQDRRVRAGRLQIFNNWSPYMVADWQNKVWIGMEYFCREGDDLWQMSDADFVRMAAGELVLMGMIGPDDVLDSIRINVPKAYPAYFGTYDRFERLKSELLQFDNLHCIGRNGQHRYNNMDHSMLTAIQAVAAAVAGAPAAAVWEVNTEAEYHETKSSAGA